MKRFIDMQHSLCLPVCFCFYQLGLCWVIYTANEYSICHFCVIIKYFFISFSRVIIVQDFETVSFCVLFVYKPTFSVIFWWKFNSLFILYISTPNISVLWRAYWSEDKQTRHLVSFDPTNFEMSKIYQGNFQSLCCLASYFSIPR